MIEEADAIKRERIQLNKDRSEFEASKEAWTRRKAQLEQELQDSTNDHEQARAEWDKACDIFTTCEFRCLLLPMLSTQWIS